jgi:hypothetical protein
MIVFFFCRIIKHFGVRESASKTGKRRTAMESATAQKPKLIDRVRNTCRLCHGPLLPPSRFLLEIPKSHYQELAIRQKFGGW